MSKKFRIIPSVQYKNGSVVKSKQYKDHRVVGDLASTMRVFSRRQADELVFYDLDALKTSEINWEAISICVDNSNMPLTYGGGVNSADLANSLIARGFDKISFNSAVFEDPKTIYAVARLIGSSSTVATLDLKAEKNKLFLYSRGGTKLVGEFQPQTLVRELENMGVGEIIISNIDLDGSMSGYCFDGLECLLELANLPVLISGGCSGACCIKEAYENGFDGAIMSSIFLWQGDSIPSLKDTLINDVPVRSIVL